jgi:multidrug transporter EmrE-like cation transporter
MSSGLSGRGLVLAIATAVCSAAGIVLLKRGLDGGGVKLLPFVSGTLISGFGLALGIWLIGRYSVSVAYPIVVGLSLVMLAAISALALGEMLTPLKLAGTGLIVAGVAVLTRPGTPSVSGV